MTSDQNHKHPIDVPAHTPTPNDAEKTLEENKLRSASGLSWDEVEPKPGEKFNRVTEMGEAD